MSRSVAHPWIPSLLRAALMAGACLLPGCHRVRASTSPEQIEVDGWTMWLPPDCQAPEPERFDGVPTGRSHVFCRELTVTFDGSRFADPLVDLARMRATAVPDCGAAHQPGRSLRCAVGVWGAFIRYDDGQHRATVHLRYRDAQTPATLARIADSLAPTRTASAPPPTTRFRHEYVAFEVGDATCHRSVPIAFSDYPVEESLVCGDVRIDLIGRPGFMCGHATPPRQEPCDDGTCFVRVTRTLTVVVAVPRGTPATLANTIMETISTPRDLDATCS